MKSKNDAQLYGLPPQNVEAEASLLSALLIDNRILDDVVDVLIPEDFYRSAHQLIYQTMIELVEKREPIDLVTLTNILRDRGELETVGGAIYLAKLIDEVPLAVNAGHYAKIIHDKATLSIRAKTRRLKLEKGLGLVIIDYLQLMKVTPPNERRDLDISEISRSLKGLAKELQIPVIALSQLNRQLEKRDDKRPRLSDLRESGSLEQDADVIAFIHREEVFKKKDEKIPFEGKAELIVAKQRNGPTDSLPLAFLKSYTRFENLIDAAER